MGVESDGRQRSAQVSHPRHVEDGHDDAAVDRWHTNRDETAYAADNSTAWIIGLPSIVTEYSKPCSQTPVIPADVLSHKRVAYDGAGVGTAATRGLVTSAWEASGFSGSTLDSAQWIQTVTNEYDAMGRPTKTTDAAQRTVQTAYVPAATAAAGAGPLASTTTTNPLGWTSKTTVDPYRGLPIEVVDENGKTSTTDYDARGRLVAAWGTDRPKAANPSSPTVAYQYTVSTTAPSSVKSTTLTPTGTMSTFTLFDGLGRVVQTQRPVVGAGTVLNDTAYDKAGQVVTENTNYWAPAVSPSSTLFVPQSISQIETRTETVYDGAGRATAQLLRAFGSELHRTTTAYRGADRVDQTPPAGGIPTSTFTDTWGRTTKVTEWAGAIDGSGVESASLVYQYNGRDQLTRMTDDDGNQWTWVFDLRGRNTSKTDPDAGATTTTFDVMGNPVTVKDARNTTLGYVYDALGRRTEERLGSTTGTVRAKWVYDTLQKGRVSSSSRFEGGLEYKTAVKGYDGAYRPTGSVVTIPSGAPALAGTYTKDLAYYADGSLGAVTHGAVGSIGAEQVYWSYNSVGQPSTLAGTSSYVSQTSWLQSGELGQIRRAGTTQSTLTFGYQAGTRLLASLDETARRGAVYTQEALREYTRNAAGVVTKARTSSEVHAADTQCFRYDGVQALTDAWTPSSGDCGTGPTAALGGPAAYRVAYATDVDTGNRLTATGWSGAVATVSSFTYPGAGAARPHAVTSVSTKVGAAAATVKSYGYDAAGSMTSRAGGAQTFDASGRVVSVTSGGQTEQSVYTADGELLLRWGGTDGASLFLGETTVRLKGGVTSAVRTYTHAGVTVAERVLGAGAGLWWMSPDASGTVGLQINVTTGVSTRRWMDPFGNPRGVNPAWSSLHGFLNQPASSTGITQLGARAYDPWLGKFLSVDPVLDTADPRHANAYAYAYNSPISYSDASGMKPIGANDYADNGAWNAATNTATPVESTGKSTPKVAPYAAGPTAGGPGSPYAAKETGPSVSHGSMDTQAMLATSAGLLAGFALVALGAACIAATAGICAGFVGPAAIVFVGAISGAGASMTQYHFEPGEKSAEGYRDSFSHGGWWGLAFGGAGIAGAALGKASVAGAPVAGLSTQASSAAQKAVAVLSDARVVSGRFPHSAGPDEVLMRVGADGRVTNYQVYGSDGLPVKRVDVTGKAHGGVATPHVVDFERHVNPVTGQIFVRPAGSVRPTTAEELAGVESF